MSKAAELAALIANVNKGSSLGSKNLVINGGMTVSQRSSSAVAVSNGSNEDYQTLDRFFFKYANSAGGACNISQDTDVPSGYGFTNSYKVDVTTADTSISATHMISIGYKPEAQDIASCGWVHTSSSSYMTLSFWAKSVKAGTYCVSIHAPDSSSTRKFVKEYTLVANTWKKVEITFAGESGVTVNNDNGTGLDIRWTLQAGSSRDNATDNTWNSSDTSIATSNQVNFFDDVANNFFLTGVMLEVGEKASPHFEHINDFGKELAQCHRYYQEVSMGALYLNGLGTDYIYRSLLLPVKPRATPTIAVHTQFQYYTGGNAANFTPTFGVSGDGLAHQHVVVFGSSLTNANGLYTGTFSADAEL